MAFEAFGTTIPYWQVYLFIGILCAFLEIFAPGFILLPIGIALIVTGAISIFLDQLILQLLVMAVSLFLVFLVSRKWFSSRPREGIKTGVSDLVGKTGVAETVLTANSVEKGYVKVYGDSWQAILEEGESVNPGEKVTILAIDGNKVKVKKV